MLNKIIVVFSSHLSPEENDQFIKDVKYSIGVPCEVYCYPNFNEYSLSSVYNRALAEHDDKNSAFVFMHNDIIFVTKNWGKRLLAKFNNTNYSIIGLAGSMILGEKAVWWEVPQTMIGIVNHTNGLRTWTSEYSKEFAGVKPVVVIDGCFMAVDPNNITDKFDEEFAGFHFYDLSLCVPNYLNGVDIGVITDIRITHKSIGITNDQWEQNRQFFIQKYSADLPIILEV